MEIGSSNFHAYARTLRRVVWADILEQDRQAIYAERDARVAAERETAKSETWAQPESSLLPQGR